MASARGLDPDRGRLGLPEARPFVSVVIPVFNDRERLHTCLRALEAQTYPKNLYEVVVIDNGSDRDVTLGSSIFTQTRFEREDRPGSYAARNKGLSVARGDAVAFTDADCIPDPAWLTKGIATLLSTPNCGLVGGKVSIFFRDPDRPTAVERYHKLTGFQQQQHVEERGYAVTANAFTYRKVIQEVGVFDDRLRSGGDYEWSRRVAAFGYRQVYASNAIVRHPARYSLRDIHNKHVRRAAGAHQMTEISKARQGGRGYPLGFEFYFFRQLAPPVLFTFRAMVSRDLGGLRDRVKVVLVLLFIRILYVSERVRLKQGGTPRGI